MASKIVDAWLAEAWISALQDEVMLDHDRLKAGRSFAKQDRVSCIEVSPGLIRAEVDGSKAEPYVAQIGLALLDEARWGELLADIMEQSAMMAAVLAGDMPRALADRLLPTRREVLPDCSCPRAAEFCKHAAALCHAVSSAFETDPFALALVRGMGREDILKEVRNRRAASLGIKPPAGADLPRGVDPGASAASAYRRTVLPLERSAPLPARPGMLVDLASPPPAGSGLSLDDLQALVADAARRSFAFLSGEADSGLTLATGSDVVRRAQYGNIAQISAHTKIAEPELRRAAMAWRFGEAAAVSALRKRWEATPVEVALGVAALGSDAKHRGNSVTLGDLQLRVDQEGRWWKLERDEQLGWLLTAESAADPRELL